MKTKTLNDDNEVQATADAEPETAIPQIATEPSTEDPDDVNIYLERFRRAGRGHGTLQFKDSANYRDCGDCVVEVCGTRLQFRFFRPDKMRDAGSFGFVMVKRGGAINGKPFTDMIRDDMWDDESCISQGGSMNPAANRVIDKQAYLFARPAAAYQAEQQIQAERSAGNPVVPDGVDGSDDADQESRIRSIGRKAGLKPDDIRLVRQAEKVMTSSQWSKVRGSAK